MQHQQVVCQSRDEPSAKPLMFFLFPALGNEAEWEVESQFLSALQSGSALIDTEKTLIIGAGTIDLDGEILALEIQGKRRARNRPDGG